MMKHHTRRAKGAHKSKQRHSPQRKKIESLPIGMQLTSEMRSADARWPKKKPNTFSPRETGQPDSDEKPDRFNPQGVQGGRGPMNEEGEGDRQNDELAELEQVEPDIKLG